MADFIHRQQQDVIACLQEEKRINREKFGGKGWPGTDAAESLKVW